MPPFFSIVTVTRDNLVGLQASADSLLRQDCRDFEWIVIDGDSRDGTQDFLGRFFFPFAAPFHWTSEPDRGLYDAMNKGIARAVGAYTLFLNAGDRLAVPDVLGQIKTALDRESADFLYGDALERHRGESVFKPARPAASVVRGMFTHHQAMVYRTAPLRALRYDLRYPIAADYDLTCRFLRAAPRALYLPRPLCIFEAGGVSQKRAAQARAEQYAVRRALGLCGFWRNAAVYLMQCGTLFLRRAAPGLYWRLRSGATGPPCPSCCAPSSSAGQ